ncbi:TonB-dependent receptor [Methylopila henanensis]|uniref:TonB-dependent receptor n=1 Tax=Methylopila henanensis TaxID=873516 RepID=A0ABW4K303_9HYPH
MRLKFVRAMAFGASGLALAMAAPVAAQDTIALPEIDVIGTTPLGGDGLDRDKVPGNVQSISSDQLRGANSLTVQDGISRVSPSVNLSDVTGNPFNKELFFRGFQASQQNGAPQGLAVYQNGVRVNEAFGDTVNFEFIPSVAIDSVDIWTNNPVFGLNALGGALSFQTKSGFTFQGVELEAQIGSFGERRGSAQWGAQYGNWAGYIALEGGRDGGWRDYSDSNVKRVFGDIGYRTDRAEIHLNFTYADSSLGVVGPTPFELLEQRRRNVYTGDQINDNTMGMLNLQGKFEVTDAWSLQANAYYRRYKSKRVDGNDTDIRPCPEDGPYAGKLCLEGDDYGFDGDEANEPENADRLVVRDPVTGRPIDNIFGDEDDFGPGSTPGSIERSRISTHSAGGTLQATNQSELFGHKNHFVIGAAYDFGKTDFRGWSELCIIPQNLQCIETGQFYYTTIPGGILPVDLTAKNHYIGLYAINTFDVTDKLSATVGGRWNHAKLILNDKSRFSPLDEDGEVFGPNLDGNHTFHRFNPMGGLTYKITPAITGFASYSESNRAPTALELGCSNPAIPCPLESTLVSDPPLDQVITRTGEVGFRGRQDFAGGALNWSASLYRSNNKDDILNVPSEITGRGYFLNAGRTRRQGIEVSAQFMAERWALYANYSYVDATFRKAINLASPNNPASAGYGEDDDDDDDDRVAARIADPEDGEIQVRKGDRLTGIPDHQLKFGGAFRVTPKWTVGADAVIMSGQYYLGDESNQNKKLPGYAVFNVNTSYQVTEQLRLFGGVRNLFDKKYSTYGTFFETDDIGFLGLEDPRSQTPARPLSIYAGVNMKFGAEAAPVLVTKN